MAVCKGGIIWGKVEAQRSSASCIRRRTSKYVRGRCEQDRMRDCVYACQVISRSNNSAIGACGLGGWGRKAAAALCMPRRRKLATAAACWSLEGGEKQNKRKTSFGCMVCRYKVHTDVVVTPDDKVGSPRSPWKSVDWKVRNGNVFSHSVVAASEIQQVVRRKKKKF